VNDDLHIARRETTLRNAVEDRLRTAIVTGRFIPGQRLVERELCELMNVGRTSVREAIRQLEAEGLVTTIPHRGPSVSTISAEDAEQLYVARGLLEGFAGQQLAERGTPEEVQRLTVAVEQFEIAVESQEPAALLVAKNAFYAALTDGCGNQVVQQMLGTLHNRVNLLRIVSMTRPGRLAHSLSEIRDIHAAIVAGDGPRANAACRFHVEQAAHALLSYLRDTVDPSHPS
jgi:DNA-binding GntR family transcriptional regulator